MPKRSLHALDYLQAVANSPPAPVCVCYGDQRYLKREVISELTRCVLGDEDREFSRDLLSGSTVDPQDVFDALSTVPLFGGPKRLVIVEAADDFIKNYRAALEEYVVSPARTGVLVLEVKSWSKGTRLAKQIDKIGLQIECKAPSETKLRSWLPIRAQSKHGAKLDAGATEVLLEMVDPDLGRIDQELAKLALLAGPNGTIDAPLVRDAVGSWRTRTTWDLIDAAAAGKAPDALLQLDRLLLAGEQPIALFGQIASTLRRFAAAASLLDPASQPTRGMSLTAALEQAGFPRFVLRKAEQQLKQLGRARANQLYGRLLAADLALKGDSASPPRARLVLEELIVWLSLVADPRRSGVRG